MVFFGLRMAHPSLGLNNNSPNARNPKPYTLNPKPPTQLRFSKKESAPWITAVQSAKKLLHNRSREHPALFLLSVVTPSANPADCSEVLRGLKFMIIYESMHHVSHASYA